MNDFGVLKGVERADKQGKPVYEVVSGGLGISGLLPPGSKTRKRQC